MKRKSIAGGNEPTPGVGNIKNLLYLNTPIFKPWCKPQPSWFLVYLFLECMGLEKTQVSTCGALGKTEYVNDGTLQCYLISSESIQ